MPFIWEGGCSLVQKGLYRLENDLKVAIVGGGPAGSLFALYLLRYAGERNIRPDITLYEERKFNECGSRGCKGCSGILSISFLKNLRELGLKVPEEIIQSKIEHNTTLSTAFTLPSASATLKEK